MAASHWYTHHLRARYAETDQMGVIYHANYLTWFEIGRTEMIRQLGYPYRKLEEQGLLLPVIDLDMHFAKPARYDDLIRISTRITDYTNIRMTFEVRITKVQQVEQEDDGELLVSGHTRHVWLGRDWRPVRLDRRAPELVELLQGACTEIM